LPLFVFYLHLTGNEFPYVKIYNHGFKLNGSWFIENCPTTLGKPCPVCEANTVLWKTEVKENQDIVRNRKRGLRYISNILVLSDPKHPENEGKVFLFKYGAKIFNKLMEAIKPEFEDEQSFNPFDFWEGANFKLKIRNVENYKNYDKSEFETPGPLFESDEAMEKVWGLQYDLNEFLDEKLFKSYDELNDKFVKFLNSSKPVPSHTSDGYNGPANEDFNVTQKSTRITKPNTPSQTSDDDDDDFSLFQSMIDD
jgi:hypothetical protein